MRRRRSGEGGFPRTEHYRDSPSPRPLYGAFDFKQYFGHTVLFPLVVLSIGSVGRQPAPIDGIGQAAPARRPTMRGQDDLRRACHRVATIAPQPCIRCGMIEDSASIIRTMMQPCASAARLLGGGPILSLGVQAMGWGGSPPPRIVLALYRAGGGSTPSLSNLCLLLSCFDQTVHIAGRRTAPAGTSPVVT